MTLVSRLILLLICFTGAAQAQVPARQAEPIPADRIVAVVNDEVVTLYELRTRLNMALAQLQRQGTPLPPRDVLERQMLERLIMDKVQLQHAREIGLRIDDAQLEGALQRIAASNKMSLPQFRDALQKDGVSFAKFREDIRSEMTIARVREREVESKLVISEGEIDNYLSGDPSKGSNEEYEVAHILLRAPESASPEQLQRLRAKTEQIYARVLKGEKIGLSVGTTIASRTDTTQHDRTPTDPTALVRSRTSSQPSHQCASCGSVSPNASCHAEMRAVAGSSTSSWAIMWMPGARSTVRTVTPSHIVTRAPAAVTSTRL